MPDFPKEFQFEDAMKIVKELEPDETSDIMIHYKTEALLLQLCFDGFINKTTTPNGSIWYVRTNKKIPN